MQKSFKFIKAHSNPRILCFYLENSFCAENETRQFLNDKKLQKEIFSNTPIRIFFGGNKKTLSHPFLKKLSAFRDIECQLFICDNEISFLKEVSKNFGEFNLDNHFAELEQDWKNENLDDKKFYEKKISLRKELPYIIYFKEIPFFYFPEIISTLLKDHITYTADITFFDNANPGISPLIVAPWFINNLPDDVILAVKKECGSFQDYILKNLNKYDVELNYLEPDLSFFRISFQYKNKNDISLKKHILSYHKKPKRNIPLTQLSYKKMAEVMLREGSGLRLTPHYFEIEITNECRMRCSFCPRQYVKNERGEMSVDLFEKILYQIEEIEGSEKTICLGGLGEPLLHSKFDQIIDLLGKYASKLDKIYIETSAAELTAQKTKSIFNNLKNKITLIINLSSLNEKKYKEIYNWDLESVLKNIQFLIDYLKKNEINLIDAVVMQQLKITEVEDEIESFFNAYEKQVTVLLQKYNNYRGLLPDKKISDLTPLNRSFCWHLARDMFILADGSYVFCKQDINDPKDCFNLNNTPILHAWEKRKVFAVDNYKGELSKKHKCSQCDEWYTFNA
jgi:spiro-SPASM protein